MKKFIFLIFFLSINYSYAQEVEGKELSKEYYDHILKENENYKKAKFITEERTRALDFGYDFGKSYNFVSLNKKIKNADELSLYFGYKFKDQDIDYLNSQYKTNFKYGTGRYDDCLILRDIAYKNGRIGYLYQTTSENSITKSPDPKEIIKVLQLHKNKRIIWGGKSKIPEALAKTLSEYGITFFQNYQSAMNQNNQKAMQPVVIVYSSRNAKKATEIFEGQDGVNISKITRNCSKFNNFIVVENIDKLKNTLEANKKSRPFVVYHNRNEINELVLKYNAQSITCNSFEIKKGDFLSTNFLDFESIVKAFEKTKLSPNTLDGTMRDVSEQYNIALKKKNIKVKAMIYASGISLLSSVITALHFLFASTEHGSSTNNIA
ncbi:hypothetical protein [Mucilaginibacter sp.]|uniref:hypothetical protein n=1 Tax=Mucilaginibacter sp. TaxID=1882438 RepID=UPI0025F04DB5|nr:hypothetical protein [Mucilaginibacter sp.]